MIRKINISALLVISVLFSCHKSAQEETPKNYIIDGQTIVLPEGSNIIPKIKTEKAVVGEYSPSISTVGTVRAIPTNYAEILPPFSGRVLKSYVNLGEKVVAGAPLFSISSPDFFNAQKEYFDSKQELALAQTNLKRQQDLFNHGVGIKRELEEAHTDVQTKKSALENAVAVLKTYNVNLSNMSLGQPLVVTSPIAGEIVTNNIIMGEYLKEDSEPIVKIAELSKVWIVGQVKEKNMNFLHNLKKVEIKTEALPGETLYGKIYHINEMIDESTRSVEVFVESNNSDRNLKPGMYVNVLFSDCPIAAIIIPSKAVLQNSENQFVYVQTGNNKYIKKEVVTENISEDKVRIKSGLQPGETYVAEGGIYLLDAQ
ncbi:efflux RND transporter periplasmic adaptor subunit [Apibacter muscae]|uniref:efflux RND transporter periplasmic adaptor subunit n=1 Tax=Apibacter muscae TaxID=2509004 RepID=UPI0011ABB25F|nr:efflux RND transporter periplasmic adaptor subunit [Apibacter muscae]TWP23829.1 efflux RND transporter periplasmic adaptor subunit [Apibacter muscae]